MSQSSVYSDECIINPLSPLNFETIEQIKKVPSSSNLFSKYSKSFHNYKLKKSYYNEKDKTSIKTKSSSITTNTTNFNSNNSNKINSGNKERNKIYKNLTNILSQFLLNEEILINSNFIPKSYMVISKSKKISEKKNINNSNISNNDGEIVEYLLSSKNEIKSSLPLIIEPNKADLSYEKCYYYKKLSENIVTFYNEIIYNNEIIFPLKKKLNSIVLKIINQSINTSLKPYNIINLIIYGSQASGLSLPESDIDLLLIYYDSNNSLEKLINELYKCLQMSHKFNNVTSLPKASSPLIKIEYKINLSQLDIFFLHMDISFHNIFPNKTTIYFSPSLLIVKYIQRSIEYLPQSKNIIILIKKYLKNIGLNNYYTGGLSSFSIFLLVFSFYKYAIKILGNEIVNNFYIGQFLIQFLDFYSKFKFSQYIVNINKEIPFIIKENSKICEIKSFSNSNTDNTKINVNFINTNNAANAVILDPFTLNNIAANSFRIVEIQQKFDSLKKNILDNFQKMYKIKKFDNINISNNNFDKFNNNKNKYRNKDIFHYNYKNLSIKELINTDDSFEYDFNNIIEKEKLKDEINCYKKEGKGINKKISFEEYEKENDRYNNNISPNFLELSIK